MRRPLYAAAIVLAVAGLFAMTIGLAFSRDAVPGQRGGDGVQHGFVPGAADVSVVVDNFPAPVSVEIGNPVSFPADMTVTNDGPDDDQIVIVKTLAIPTGCSGSLVGSLDTTGADTAVVFTSLPVLEVSNSTPNSDTVGIECQSSGFFTFIFRVEAQPLYADDSDQTDNTVTIPFTVCEVSDPGGDPDNDGNTNLEEEFAGTNPCAADTDGDGIDDGDDNCGLIDNLDQLNTDSGPPPPAGDTGGIGNGPTIPGHDATVPNGDGEGDACDLDLDNDSLPNDQDGPTLSGCAPLGEPANHANPTSGDVTYNDNGDFPILNAGDNGPSWDTDGDFVRDGIECAVGTNPRFAAGADMPTCRTFAGGTADTDGDGIDNSAEICKWGSLSTDPDSDDDGLGDCTEVMDVNGNQAANAADGTLVLQAVFAIIGNDGVFDINGNGLISAADATLIRQAAASIIPCS
jgi:hypothetical protein